MFQCHILSEHYVSTFFSTRFLKIIHLVICFHEHKVCDHHRIQTQTTHEVITFLTNGKKQDNIQVYISYKQNKTYLNKAHVISPLCRSTSHHNITPLIHFHNIHILKDQNTISLSQLISINTQALCNIYTKIQSYMQCDTMSVKNLVRRLGVHDKTNHTLVSQVTLTR